MGKERERVREWEKEIQEEEVGGVCDHVTGGGGGVDIALLYFMLIIKRLFAVFTIYNNKIYVRVFQKN